MEGKVVKAMRPSTEYWQHDIDLHKQIFGGSSSSHRIQKKYFAIYSSDWCVHTAVGDHTVSFGRPSRHTEYFDTIEELQTWMNDNNIHIGKTFEVKNHERDFEDPNTYVFPITRIEFLYRYMVEYTGSIPLHQHMLTPDDNIIHQNSKFNGLSSDELWSESEQSMKYHIYTAGLPHSKDNPNNIPINFKNCMAFVGKSRKDLNEI